jgi:hypothetical protein
VPRPKVIDIQESFSGLNTTASEDQLQPTEIRQAANVKFTAYSAATKRNGTQRVHTTSLGVGAPIQGGYYWDTQALYLVVCEGTLFTSPGGAFPWTWTQRGATNFFSLTAKISFAAFTSSSNGGNEVVYMADGAFLSLYASGPGLIRFTALSPPGSPPTISYLAVYNKRLLAVNGIDPTLYWSSLGDGNDLGIPSSPDAGGNDVIKTFGENACLSLLPMAAGLLILHKRGTSTFTGWSQNDISVSSGTAGISADIGTLAPFGNVAVENNAFVVSDRGVYQLTPYGIYEQISKPIESILNGLSRSLFPLIVAAHDKVQRQVLFFFPTLGVYAWNYRTNGWSGPWDSIYLSTGLGGPCSALWPAVDQNNTPIVLGGFSDGFVRQTEVPGLYLDDVHSDGTGGNIYNLVLQSRRLLAEDAYSLKMIRWIYVTVGATSGNSLIAPSAIQWGFGPTPSYTALPSGSSSAASGSTVPWRFQGAGHGAWVSIFINDQSGSPLYYSKLGAEGYDYGRSRYSVGGGGNPTSLISSGGN